MPLAIIPPALDGLPNALRAACTRLHEIYETESGLSFLYVGTKIRHETLQALLLDPARGVAVIEVSDWSVNSVVNADGRNVTLKGGSTTENPTFTAQRYGRLVEACLRTDEALVDDFGDDLIPVTAHVYWSRMNSASNLKPGMLNKRLKVTPHFSVSTLSPETLFAGPTAEFDAELMGRARSALIPEAEVIRAQPSAHGVSDQRVIRLLDEEQEALAKSLPDGHAMVSGVPGSGKTVVLVARALYLARHNPDWNILVLTYNKSLAGRIKNAIEAKREDLSHHGSSAAGVEVLTFHSLCKRVSRMTVPQNAPRKFWDEDLPNAALKVAGQNQYDAVLVDEYQDFHATWFRLCVALARQHSNGRQSLFFAGDRLQSIYSPKVLPWKSLGINIQGRGHSTVLKHSYRVGSEHITLALKFLREAGGLKSEVQQFYEGDSDFTAEESIPNSIEVLKGNPRDIAQHIEALLSAGATTGEIMVLVPKKDWAKRIKDALRGDIRNRAECTKDPEEQNTLQLVTYHSAKGLERPHVLATFIEEVSDPKLLYVGLTRASNTLYLHATNWGASESAEWLRSQAS